MFFQRPWRRPWHWSWSRGWLWVIYRMNWSERHVEWLQTNRSSRRKAAFPWPADCVWISDCFGSVIYDGAGALGRRWFQVRTSTGKEAGVWMGVEPHQKPPWLLWQTLWQPFLEQHVRDSFSFKRRQKMCRSEKSTFHSPCVTTGRSVYNPNGSTLITVV